MGKKILFVERTEIGGCPGGPQHRGAPFEIAGVYHDLGFAHLPGWADRRIELEPRGCDRIRFPGQGLLDMFAQSLLSRPVGVLLDKLGDLGKATGGARTCVVYPPQHFQRQRIGYGRGACVSAAPIAALGGGEGGAHHLHIGRRQCLGRNWWAANRED
jgi:hypothetical protein